MTVAGLTFYLSGNCAMSAIPIDEKAPSQQAIGIIN